MSKESKYTKIARAVTPLVARGAGFLYKSYMESKKAGKVKVRPASSSRAKPIAKSYKPRGYYDTPNAREYSRGNPRADVQLVHGKPDKRLSKSFVNQIKKSLAARNDYLITFPFQQSSAIGQCNYVAYDLANAVDLNVIQGYVTASAPTTLKYTLMERSQTLNCTNMSSGQMFMRVYDISLRHDLPVSETSLQNLVTSGFSDAATNTSVITATSIGGTLFDNPRFVAYCKVNSVKILEFAPGQAQILALHDNQSKVVNGEIMRNTDLVEVAGISRALILQIWGQAVDDSVNPTTVQSTDKCRMTVIASKKYTYTWMADTSVTTSYSSTLGSVIIPQYIEPLTGAVITDSQG